MNSSVKSSTQPADTPPIGDRARGENRTRHWFRAAARSAERLSIVGAWIVMIAVFSLLRPDTFAQQGTFQTIFGSQQAMVFLALALVCSLTAGEFDLSIASIFGLSATLVPVLAVNHGWPLWLSIATAVLACLGAGAVNGFLVVVVRVSPIVATLGNGTFLAGVALGVANLQNVGGLDPSVAKIGQQHVLGLPLSFYYGIALAALIAYAVRYTPIGRAVLFIGSNREVARLAGIRVDLIRFGVYLLCALICGLGGVLYVISSGGFDPSASQTYLLPAFSAAFLGTAIIQPGRFNAPGTMIAIYFLVTGIVGLQLLGLAGWISQVFYGGALMVSIAIAALVGRRTGTSA